MKKYFYISFLLFSICGLGACAAQPSPTPILVEPILIHTPTPAVGCSSIFAAPTSAPNADSYFPPVSSADFTLGRADAPVTIIEYCDFQAEGCRSLAVTLGALMKKQNNLRLVFRPLPLTGVLDKSEQAILAALAADEQGKFWEMYDLLFIKHAAWVNLSSAAFHNWLIQESAALGLDVEKFEAAMPAERTATRMRLMYNSAKKLSLPAVPLLLINGSLQPAYLLDYQSLSDTVGLIALGKKQFAQCPSFSVNPQKQYIATLYTEKGDIVMQLFADKAPLAVNSFVFLARQGWFDGVTFHRVLPGLLAQSGDPSGTGKGNPGYFFNNEISDLKFDQPGRVGMANNGADTNGSQFFITFASAAHLNGEYTIFGQVIGGLEVAEKLTPHDVDQGAAALPADKILRVAIEEK